jgi:hypothetical protein
MALVWVTIGARDVAAACPAFAAWCDGSPSWALGPPSRRQSTLVTGPTTHHDRFHRSRGIPAVERYASEETRIAAPRGSATAAEYVGVG